MRILVVTDKYPPQMVGGAELSLHVLLKLLRPKLSGLLVAVLDGKVDVPRKVHEGIEVVHLPALGEWPTTQTQTFHARGIGPSALTSPVKAYEAIARYILKGGPRSARDSFSRVQNIRRIHRAKGRAFLPPLDDDLVNLCETAPALSQVIADFDPDLIHADNYRSILTTATAERNNIPFTAMVRDHRFFCTLNEQSSHINGKVCTGCAFECVDIAEKSGRSSAIKIMSEVHEFRIQALSKASEVITTSDYLKRQTSKTLPTTKLRAIGNPSDTTEYLDKIKRKVTRANPPEILIVGMLNDNKGQREVVSWIQKLKTRLDDFRIVVAGRGGLAKRLEGEARKAGVSDHLILTGFLDREAIYRAYKRASVVLAPNRWPEPFGRTPLEAGICERPIIAYNLGGISESIVDNGTGRLVEPQNEDALLDAIVEIVSNPPLAKQMGQRGKSFIQERYAPTLIATRLFQAWEENVKSEKTDLTTKTTLKLARS